MSPEELKEVVNALKSIIDITSQKPNQWLPLYAALGGAAMGALASFIPTWIFEKRREKVQSIQIESSLISEISALIDIIETRKYLPAIQEAIKHLDSDKTITHYKIIIDVPAHYSRVYQNNCKNIGAIKPEVARNIILFHQIIDAVIQDLKPGAIVQNDEIEPPANSEDTLDTFREVARLLEQALSIGRNLSKQARKYST
ncbi:hypothetical protein [Hahella chejuensis]|uniref:hypothetical protein n=1 Tax=Hahella chejuensis TaxID=158327 RepID=UPI0006743978|nr:hypothetical protein [Hahella chejuensis]